MRKKGMASLVALVVSANAASAQSPAANLVPVRDPVEICRVAASHLFGDGFTLSRAEVLGEAPVSSFKELDSVRNPALQASVLPESCVIGGNFERRTGLTGKPYAIGMELRIPKGWNGSLVFQGGGAFKGTIEPAVGMNVSAGSSATLALARGFAVVTTNSGHTGAPGDSSFANDQLAMLNYAYAAVGKVARMAKRILRDVARRSPRHTYFSGCSNGGREAMMAAQRFPEEFDGIVAANPAHQFSQDQLMKYYSIQAYARLAPRARDDGRGQPWLAMTNDKWTLLSSAVVAQCDALDGLKDGIIFDQAACRFKPTRLQCRSGQATGCLSPEEVAVVDDAFQGPLDGKGRPLLSGWVYDASIDMKEWRSGQTGYVTSAGTVTSPEGGRNVSLANSVLYRLFRYPEVSVAQVMAETPAEQLAQHTQRNALLNAESTELSTFAHQGSKVLLVHGWSDPVLSPMSLVNWYEKLRVDHRAVTGQQAEDFARLFMVPGLTHCGGGRSLDDFDALGALVNWVEQGKAPERLIAKGTHFPKLTRPLCAYPKIARYNGTGDSASASNFTCSL